MYNYGYGAATQATKVSAGAGFFGIWQIVAVILAVIGGLLVYFLFVKPDKEQSNKFLAWLKDFCNFKKMLIEVLLKIGYIIAALFVTIGSIGFFGLGGIGFLLFLFSLTFGNIILRVIYEAALLKIMIWKNTTEINNKMK